MTNPARRKGTGWENSVRDLAIERGFRHAHRLGQAGTKDVGDVWIAPNAVIECKATKTIDLASAVSEAKREADTAGAAWWLAAIKRRQHSAGHGYAVTELNVMLDLLGAVLL